MTVNNLARNLLVQEPGRDYRHANAAGSRAAPRSPIEQAYGSLEAFEAEVNAGIAAGTYDSRHMPLVLGAMRKWHRDRVWGNWRHHRNNLWDHQ